MKKEEIEKWMVGYPKHIQEALRKMCIIAMDDGYCVHTTKYYPIGFFAVNDALQRETVENLWPHNNILHKYYPETSGCSFTFGFDTRNERIFPAYHNSKTGEYHNLTEEMMGNKKMWDEIAGMELPKSTVEYREELPLGLQYEEWKQKQNLGESDNAKVSRRNSFIARLKKVFTN